MDQEPTVKRWDMGQEPIPSNPTLDSEIKRIIKEYGIQHAQLTERQLALCFKQAVEAGDFVKFVYQDKKAFYYMPEREVYKLRSRISTLEKLLEENNIELP